MAGNHCRQLAQRQQQRRRSQPRLQLPTLVHRQPQHGGSFRRRQLLCHCHVAQKGGEEQVALVLLLARCLQHGDGGAGHRAAQPAVLPVQEAHHKLQHLFALGSVLGEGGRVARG